MGLKDLVGSWFDKDARQQRVFDKLVSKLVSKNYQHEDRMWAIEQLGGVDTPEGTAALFRRFDVTADKQREDTAEKEYLAEVLAAKGRSMLPQMSYHLDRSANVARPVQVLARVVEPEEVVTELLRVLAAEQERIAAFKPIKKIRLLQLLNDYIDDERMQAGVLPSLEDFDENVRYEAVLLLGKVGDDTVRDALISRLASDEEDSARVQQSIIEVLAEREWSVVHRKDDIAAHLGKSWRIGPKNTVVRAD